MKPLLSVSASFLLACTALATAQWSDITPFWGTFQKFDYLKANAWYNANSTANQEYGIAQYGFANWTDRENGYGMFAVNGPVGGTDFNKYRSYIVGVASRDLFLRKLPFFNQAYGQNLYVVTPGNTVFSFNEAIDTNTAYGFVNRDFDDATPRGFKGWGIPIVPTQNWTETNVSVGNSSKAAVAAFYGADLEKTSITNFENNTPTFYLRENAQKIRVSWQPTGVTNFSAAANSVTYGGDVDGTMTPSNRDACVTALYNRARGFKVVTIIARNGTTRNIAPTIAEIGAYMDSVLRYNGSASASDLPNTVVEGTPANGPFGRWSNLGFAWGDGNGIGAGVPLFVPKPGAGMVDPNTPRQSAYVGMLIPKGSMFVYVAYQGEYFFEPGSFEPPVPAPVITIQ